MHGDVAEAVRLIVPWSQWDIDTRLKLARLLADNPEVQISYASDLVYHLTEASELGEPGAQSALVALKLSRNDQFRDQAGGCKLTTEAAGRATPMPPRAALPNAMRRRVECRASRADIRIH